MVGASVTATRPIPVGTEVRIGEFTELAATAIANAESRERADGVKNASGHRR